MIGTFFMKYRRPLTYAVTKVLANHIHAAITPRRFPFRARLDDVSKPIRFSTHGSPDMKDWTINRLAVGEVEHDYCVRQIAKVLPKVEVSTPHIEVVKPRMKTTQKPIAQWKPARPVATKRNGGLRGSTSSRWK